jgi:hypothetical protein
MNILPPARHFLTGQESTKPSAVQKPSMLQRSRTGSTTTITTVATPHSKDFHPPAASPISPDNTFSNKGAEHGLAPIKAFLELVSSK